MAKVSSSKRIKVSAIKNLIGSQIGGKVVKNHVELARAFGMDPSTLSRMLGARVASEEMIERMMRATSQPRDFFVGEDIEPIPTDSLRVTKAGLTIHWSDAVLVTAIQTLRHGETLDLFSTCLPHQEERLLRAELKARAKQLPLPDSPEKRLSIRVLLLHYDCQKLMDTRLALIEDPPEFGTFVKGQAQRFCSLRNDVSAKIDLTVKFYRAWPFGHYVRVDQRLLQFSPLLTTHLGTDSFAIVSSDPTSRIWEQLNENFSRIYLNNGLTQDACTVPGPATG
jgi:hypothetical protein